MKYKLNDVCEFINGGAWSDKEYVVKGLPVLKVTNCKPKGFMLEDISFLPLSATTKYAKNKLKLHDVIIATVGSHPNLVDSAAGRSCIVNSLVEGFYLNQNAVCVRTKNSALLNQRYLGYLSQYRLFRHYIQMRGRGAANQMRIAIEAIKSYEFDCPNIHIQKRIADILSAYDDLIENNQKQIKLLEEAAQRLYKEWFVDFRFPGHEQTKIVDGLPEGWSVKSILDNDVFCFAESRILPFNGEKQYYATADIIGRTISAEGVAITYINRPSRAAIQPVKNSVWFARMSNTYKILACFGANSDLADNSVISSGFAGFMAKKGCFGYVYETIVSDRFNQEKDRYATGATQVSLTNEGLGKIKVLIPCTKIVEKFSMFAEEYMKKAEILKKQNHQLAVARNMLLPKLMSGEIVV